MVFCCFRARTVTTQKAIATVAVAASVQKICVKRLELMYAKCYEMHQTVEQEFTS